MTGFNRLLAGCLLLSLTLISGCAPRMWSPENTSTTVVLVRHAERSMITGELTGHPPDRTHEQDAA